jgi:transcriptional regulator with XRE-family HTH domain
MTTTPAYCGCTPTTKTMKPQKFGEYVKDRRIAAGVTLRSFCREAGIDPSNWSKIERGVLAPPDDQEVTRRIAGLLGLNATEHLELEDLASIARGQIPADLKDEEILTKMPAFFRAIRGQEYTREDFEKLMSGVKKIHSP